MRSSRSPTPVTLYDRWFNRLTRAAETAALKMPPDATSDRELVPIFVGDDLDAALTCLAMEEIESQAMSAASITPLMPSLIAPTIS